MHSERGFPQKRYDMNNLRTMQLMLVDILKTFHDYCEMHSLRYYAAYGTALGAARHKGIIPWDDDIDVTMPRPDYEKLIEQFNDNNINKRYVLESPNSSDKKYMFEYAKIYDTKTTLIENHRHELKRGIFIDIFPLDGAGKTKEEARDALNSINALKYLRYFFVSKISKEMNPVKKAIRFITQSTLDIIGVHEIDFARKINLLAQKKSYADSDYVGCLGISIGMNGIMPKSYFGKPTLHSFEEIEIYCPEKIEPYLEGLYGNWKELPPIEKRKSDHPFKTLLLDEGYLP